MAEGEARQVLGVTEHASWEEIVQVCLIYLFFSIPLVSLHIEFSFKSFSLEMILIFDC